MMGSLSVSPPNKSLRNRWMVPPALSSVSSTLCKVVVIPGGNAWATNQESTIHLVPKINNQKFVKSLQIQTCTLQFDGKNVLNQCCKVVVIPGGNAWATSQESTIHLPCA